MEKTSLLKDRDFSRRVQLPGVLPKRNVASLAGEKSEINGFYAHLQFLPRFGYCWVQLRLSGGGTVGAVRGWGTD